MSQQWREIGGGIEVLSDVDAVSELPGIATIDEEGVWYIENGALAPDYIGPTNWDVDEGQFTDWFSLFDGQVLGEIPDSVVSHLDWWWPIQENDSTNIVEDLSGENEEMEYISGELSADSTAWEGYVVDQSVGDKEIITKNPINGINAQTCAGCLWFKYDGSGVQTLIQAHTNPANEDNGADGWNISLRDSSTVQPTTIDGGSADEAVNFDLNESMQSGEWYFAGVSLDGDFAELTFWDTNGEIGSDSGQEHSRGIDAEVYYMCGNEWFDRRDFNGQVDFIGGASTWLDKSDFEEIWEDSRNDR